MGRGKRKDPEATQCTRPKKSATKFGGNYWWYMPIMPIKIREAEASRYLRLAGHSSQPYSENPRPVRDPI